jgi:formylglycine-generating enzyme required for sulfatase activity
MARPRYALPGIGVATTRVPRRRAPGDARPPRRAALRGGALALVCAVLACLAACGPADDRAPVPVSRQAQAPPSQAPAADPSVPPPVQVAPEWQRHVPVTTLAQVPATLSQADAALARGQLEQGAAPGPGALELYLSALDADPGNVPAEAGVRASLDALLERGGLALRAGDLAADARVDTIATAVMPGHRDLPDFRKRMAAARRARSAVARADRAGKAERWVEPADASVVAHLRAAQRELPGFAPAERARARWRDDRLAAAWKAARAEDFDGAAARLREARAIDPRSAPVRVMDLRIVESRQARTQALLAEGEKAVQRLQLTRAEQVLRHAARIAAQPVGVAALRRRIHIARHYGPFQPRQVFSERLRVGGVGPEMVVVVFGEFTMGAGDDDAAAQASERPAHPVRFKRGFAVGRSEVTVGEFGRFIAASGYRTEATRRGHSRVYDEKGGVLSDHAGVDWRRDHVGRPASQALPVVHVSHEDAEAYARWLSAQSGATYRLPSEAEFEYVLRAGGDGVYPWGDRAPKRPVGNLAGDGDLSRSSRRWGNAIPGYRDAFWGPSPVRNFPEEGFGTFDTIGNVSEWTLDCWHDSYQRAPDDGSAWVNPGCPRRVVRGASWGSSLDQARSASRLPMHGATSTARLGFRVVREL